MKCQYQINCDVVYVYGIYTTIRKSTIQSDILKTQNGILKKFQVPHREAKKKKKNEKQNKQERIKTSPNPYHSNKYFKCKWSKYTNKSTQVSTVNFKKDITQI